MAAFKGGDLRGSQGETVNTNRQAVATALGEAGASNRQSPAENPHRLPQTCATPRAAKR